MEKEKFLSSYEAISKINDLFTTAEDLFNQIPDEIQQSILKYHNDHATVQHCIRWGLQAASDIRKDWHTVVANIPCE